MENISQHISFEEGMHSETATEKHIDNTPPDFILVKMKVIAEKVFEPLRARISAIRGVDSPIMIDSFYRCPDLNIAVGGVSYSKVCHTISQHTKGEAMDLNVNYDNFTRKDLFELIRKEFEFDQLIYEGGTPDNPAWVHVSYAEGANRKECLKMVEINGESKYTLI